MGSHALVGLAVLALYMILGTALALLARRGARLGEREFYVAGGRLGGFLSAMTYAATTYSSFMIVGLVGFAYFTGSGALGFELVYYASTLLLLLVFARRVWSMSRERGWISPGEMLGDIYGSRMVAALASVVYLVALIPYASSQLKGIGETIAGLAGDWAYPLGVLFGVSIMLLWSMIAGIWSVSVTDAFQGLWMLAAATLLLLWLAYSISSSGAGFSEATGYLSREGLLGLTEFWSLATFLAFTLPWMFFAVTNPQVVQRLYMPRDEASLSAMIRWFAVFGLYYTIVVTLIGLLARAASGVGALDLGPERVDQVTPQLLSLAHPLLAAVVFTSIVAASVSTADSILLTIASSASRDLGYRLGEGARARLGRASLILVAMAMVAVALSRTGYIVQLAVLSSLILLSLAPPTIAGWLGYRGDPRLVSTAILSGPAIVGLTLLATGSPRGAFSASILGLPVAAVVLLASAAITAAAIALRRGENAGLKAPRRS